MNIFEFMNDLIQGLIVIMLLYYAIKNNTLSMFEMILTLVAVGYNLFTNIIKNKLDD